MSHSCAPAAHELRICVYGAGAIGASLAVRLAHTGVRICVIARGAHGDAMRQHGITLHSGEARMHAQVECPSSARDVRDQDVVIVAVKGPSLPAIARDLPFMLKPDGLLVFAMNGLPWWFCDGLDLGPPSVLQSDLNEALDPHGLLRRGIDKSRVAGCVVSSSNEVVAPGVVLNSTPLRNRLILGRPDGQTDTAIDILVTTLASAGYDASWTPNIREALWLKMLLAVSAGPAAALTGCALDQLVRDPNMLTLMVQVMREAATTGRTLGFHIPDDAGQRLGSYRGVPTRPSMLQDIAAGRVPEIDNSIVAFDLLSRILKIPAPTLHLFCSLMQAKAQNIQGDKPQRGAQLT